MPHVPKLHLELFADQVKIHGEIKLAADVLAETFRMAGQYQTFRFTLEQIAQGNGREADWAKRAVADDDKARKAMQLRHPRRLTTLEAE